MRKIIKTNVHGLEIRLTAGLTGSVVSHLVEINKDADHADSARN